MVAPPTHRRTLISAVSLLDLVGLSVALLLATLLGPYRELDISLEQFLSVRMRVVNVFLMLGLLFAWHTILNAFQLYAPNRLARVKPILGDILLAMGFAELPLVVAALVFDVEVITPYTMLIFWIVGSTTLVLLRLSIHLWLRVRRHRDRKRKNILIADVAAGCGFVRRSHGQESSIDLPFVRAVDEAPSESEPFSGNRYTLVSDLDDLPRYIREHVVDEIVITASSDGLPDLRSRIISDSEAHGITVHFVSSTFDELIRKPASQEEFYDDLVMSLHSGSIEGWPLLVKRLFDLVLATIGLVLFLPLMGTVALAIKLTSPGPVFFTQHRVGLNRRRFRIFKFRTMVKNAEALLTDLEHLNECDGAAFKIQDDPRITRIGRFLRISSIDELPQLLNVLKGDMSLVGPRPLPPRDVERFTVDRHQRRFSMRPGLTGICQVNGRSLMKFNDWMRLDLKYIDHWSFSLDLRILVKTVSVVLKGAGAM